MTMRNPMIKSQQEIHITDLRYKNRYPVRQWWHIPSIPALGRERKVDLCELKARLVYKS